MSKVAFLLAVSIIVFAFAVNANEVPKDFHGGEPTPNIIFNWPSVRVESVKYHLARRFFRSNSYLFPILIKEIKRLELIDGREGTVSKIDLEMWELNTDSVERKVWGISQEADEWKYSGWDELVLIKYGCCSSPNRYDYYNLETGDFVRMIKGAKLPAKTNESN